MCRWWRKANTGLPRHPPRMGHRLFPLKQSPLRYRRLTHQLQPLQSKMLRRPRSQMHPSCLWETSCSNWTLPQPGFMRMLIAIPTGACLTPS